MSLLTPEQVELATTITRKHKWKKKFKMEKPSSRITGAHICIQCGLGKGHIKENFNFHELVFFAPDKILSRRRVPFPCGDEWIGGELLINSSKTDFICEEEFKV